MRNPTCPQCDCVAGCQSRERLCPNFAPPVHLGVALQTAHVSITPAAAAAECVARAVLPPDWKTDDEGLTELINQVAHAQQRIDSGEYTNMDEAVDLVNCLENVQSRLIAKAQQSAAIAQPEQHTELPPLPEARKPDDHGIGWFTAGQMKAYGRAAIAQPVQQATQNVAYICQGCDGIYWTKVDCDCNKKAAFDLVAVSNIAQPVQTRLAERIQREIDHCVMNELRLVPNFGKMKGELAVRVSALEAILETSTQPVPLAEPDDWTNGYLSGFAEGKRAAQVQEKL